MTHAAEPFNVLEMILRSTGSFVALMVITRLLGKKQMSQLTFFNYVTGITIGSIAGEISFRKDTSFFNGLTSLIWWSLLTFLVSYVGLKSSKMRILIDGEPTIVIKKGEILEKALAGARLNLDDLSMLLREKDIFSVKEVDYAILEPNGEISVLRKPDKLPATIGDLGLKQPKSAYMPMELIVDGKLVKRNLQVLDLSVVWLDDELRKSGASLAEIQTIFYAELQADGTVHVDKREDLLH